MKQFNIIGLLRREYRGKNHPSTQKDMVKAESREAAGKSFEKKYPRYTASAIEPIINMDSKFGAKETKDQPKNKPKEETKDYK